MSPHQENCNLIIIPKPDVDAKLWFVHPLAELYSHPAWLNYLQREKRKDDYIIGRTGPQGWWSKVLLHARWIQSCCDTGRFMVSLLRRACHPDFAISTVYRLPYFLP